EPLVLVGAVVRNDVDDYADADLRRFGDERLCLTERPEHRVDVAVVRAFVAAVRHWRDVPGCEPDGVYPEVVKIAQSRSNAGEVADPVAVPVGETPDVDLIDDGGAPPWRVGAPRVWLQPLRGQQPGTRASE